MAGTVKTREPGQNPATRTFQALRIFINAELEELQQALEASLTVLAPGARLAVISFHSLEDRIVKTAFAAGAKSSAPPGFPVELEQHKAYLKLLTRGTEAPTQLEVEENPRAASAKLRAVERIKEHPVDRKKN